ncbi:hypothetical protein J437_LFUL014195 [Ladona fulva]|uniref:CRC domain-containing protein n=1 Tax=Ladona fulva TaxID=123851 RepID=A0A8K0KHP7_LADFU|nr:hypothetical protein J437_LFUL014195 [Ladona fulva]
MTQSPLFLEKNDYLLIRCYRNVLEFLLAYENAFLICVTKFLWVKHRSQFVIIFISFVYYCCIFYLQVIAKVIITGNPNSGQSRPIVSMGTRTESVPSTQHVKIVGSGQSGVTTLLASPTKAITLAQAQQMGLLSPAKVQQILPRATVKQTHDTGTVLTTTASTGQMIRIPATQNVVTTTSSNVHQIQVPGRQLQYVRLVNASEGTARVTTASTPITPSTTAPTIRTQPSLRVVPIAPATEENRGSARPRSSSTPRPGQPQPRPSLEPNGIRPKKPCNCTKSQCLKLYCDCFANGEFCHLCNCANCSNNLEHEEERQRAIKSCLERNPNAFRPKIGKGHVGDERRHNKGCNCKRSGCLKNYCECYEILPVPSPRAKIPCSGMCKCVGCRNVEESPSEKKTLRDLAEAAEVRVRQQAAVKSRLSAQVREVMHPGPILGRYVQCFITEPYNFT